MIIVSRKSILDRIIYENFAEPWCKNIQYERYCKYVEFFAIDFKYF